MDQSLSPEPLEPSKPIPINLVVYTKTGYKGKEIDTEQLSLTVDGEEDLNLIQLLRRQKKRHRSMLVT